MKILRIISRVATGHRRAGRHHPPEPVEHDAVDFDEVQLEALASDPRLIIDEIFDDRLTPETDDGKTEKQPGAMARVLGNIPGVKLWSGGKTGEGGGEGGEGGGSEGGTGADAEELTPEQRADKIVAAIADLGEDGFTVDGRPRVEAIEAKAGIADISADERDQGWAKVQEAKTES